MLKTPTHLAYVATLPCETLLSAKQAINDKLQGSVAAYLRCGGLFTNQNKKGLFMNLEVTSKHDCLVHFLHLSAECWPGAQSA